jgi:hypothetical protein
MFHLKRIYNTSSIYKLWWVALGGVVVSALATGLKIRWFKPGHERWILRAKKFRSTTYFEGKQSRRSHV